jgi:ribosomal protein S13
MTNFKRIFFAIALTAVYGIGMAQSGSPLPTAPTNPANFAAFKQKELARIATHIQVGQTLQACVQGATDRESLKTCKEAARDSMGHMQG